MSHEEDAKLLREHLELMHRLNTAMVDALLEVAKAAGKSPAELAQLVAMGGGGFQTLFQPLVMRFHEEQQRRLLEMQRERSSPDPPTAG